MRGVDKIIKENFASVLICIHGRALRVMLSKIINNDLSKMDKYVHSNTECMYWNMIREIYNY
ncbi:MAG: hypothetical protein CM15mP75_2430 [Flammeovirgaceae bacterium]|nr:MAG: hypothetical protein CM15mP75_2430 [Flammeovirgaceae bacterium]